MGAITETKQITTMDNIQKRIVATIVSCKTSEQVDVAINYLDNYLDLYPVEALFFQSCQFLLLSKIVEVHSCSAI